MMLTPLQEALYKLTIRGWTHTAIARQFGLHRSTVARWATGKLYPRDLQGTVLTLRALAAKAPPVRGDRGTQRVLTRAQLRSEGVLARWRTALGRACIRGFRYVLRLFQNAT